LRSHAGSGPGKGLDPHLDLLVQSAVPSTALPS
jgi:hypothetical protein